MRPLAAGLLVTVTLSATGCASSDSAASDARSVVDETTPISTAPPVDAGGTPANDVRGLRPRPTSRAAPNPTPLSIPPAPEPARAPTPSTPTCARPGEVEVVAARVAIDDGHLNVRSGPSATAAVIARLPAGRTIEAFPESLQYDGSRWWWVAVGEAESGRCGYAAATYVRDALGSLDRGLQAISFEFPQVHEWEGHRYDARAPDRSELGDLGFHWSSVEVPTSIWIELHRSGGLDQRVGELEAYFVEIGYEPNERQFRPMELEGADRAVRVQASLSHSGDSVINRIVAEVDGVTLTFGTSVYIMGDVDPTSEHVDAWLASVRIDRAAFAAAGS